MTNTTHADTLPTSTRQCECGNATGHACPLVEPIADMVTLEYMPRHLRASHEAAGNAGCYPHNGAVRLAVYSGCADDIIEAEGDEWAQVVDVPVAPIEAERCECSCDCGEAATTTDDSDTPVCDQCSHWYESDDGDIVCRRIQDDETCRHCGQPIEWGRIQTGGLAGNRCEGSCGCEARIWSKIECGGEWRHGESMRHDDDAED